MEHEAVAGELRVASGHGLRPIRNPTTREVKPRMAPVPPGGRDGRRPGPGLPGNALGSRNEGGAIRLRPPMPGPEAGRATGALSSRT